MSQDILKITIKKRKDLWKIPKGYFIIISLATFPLLIAGLADYLGDVLGCEINEGGTNDCKIGRVNIGSFLNVLFIFGWFAMLTIPAGIGLFIGWTVNVVKEIITYQKSRIN